MGGGVGDYIPELSGGYDPQGGDTEFAEPFCPEFPQKVMTENAAQAATVAALEELSLED